MIAGTFNHEGNAKKRIAKIRSNAKQRIVKIRSNTKQRIAKISPFIG